ncbi:MAG: DNA alkylation repair protein [Anaerolineales bacterium]|nr:DNA alkylation repair protein [Anaerolineales bacterium]
MNMKEATQLAEQISDHVQGGAVELAYALLLPILNQRTRFTYLDRIGGIIGAGSLEGVNNFVARISEDKTEGGWAVIGGALKTQLDRDLRGAFSRAQDYIIAADVWYGADILGERVPGPSLVTHFEEALTLLQFWRDHPNRWVRRAVGVGAHFWAKRSKGNPDLEEDAASLINLLEPMFTEWEMDAVKGVGWGLKTLGRYYPKLMADWLPGQVHRKHRAIMRNKAMKFLSEEQKMRVKHET